MAVAQQNTQTYEQSALVPTPLSTQALAHLAAIKGPEGDDNDGLDGLGDLVRGHTAQKHEERREVKVEHTSNIERVLRKFRYFSNHSKRKTSFWCDGAEEYLDKRITEVLTPNEISVVFQAMLHISENESKRDLDNLMDWESGRFVSKLIQLSYDAGYNEFELDTRDSQSIVSNIGEKLKGSEERLIRVKICGDAKRLCHYSSYFEVDIDGNIPWEHEGDNCKYSKHGIFILRGKDQDIINYYGSDIIYKTTNKGTLPRLIFCALGNGKKEIFTREYNQIVFITPNGREDVILRYEPNVNITFRVNRKYQRFFEKHVVRREYWKDYNIKMVDNLQVRPLGRVANRDWSTIDIWKI